MNKTAILALLALNGYSMGIKAQTVYITQRANDSIPTTVKMVEGVEKISYEDNKATFLLKNAVSKSFEVNRIAAMGLEEAGNLKANFLPVDFLHKFDYEIAFSDGDRKLASLQESKITDIKNPLYDDFEEHTQWTKHVAILFAKDAVTVSGDKVEGLTFTTDKGHIVATYRDSTEYLEMTLSGACDNGSFKLYSDKKTKLTLKNLQLTNPSGPAINSQSKKRLYLVLEDENSLGDGEKYADAPKDKVTGKKEDQKGCLFSEGKICISGEGVLTIKGKKKSCIASDASVHQIGGFVRTDNLPEKGKAITANNQIYIGGGALQVLCEGGAAKGISSDSLIHIAGGKVTVITHGDAIYDEKEKDYSSSSSIKAANNIAITGGEIACLSTGVAGKGISTDGNLSIENAKIWVRTSGSRIPEVKHENEKGQLQDSISSSPKGIKAEGSIVINSGEIYVRCSGGIAAEGVEAKKTFTMNDGKLYTFCVDDGLNAEGCYQNGGELFICSSANDGVDAQFLIQKGGTLYAIGANKEQMGLDTDGKTCTFEGGSTLAIGANNCYSNGKCNVPSICCFIEKPNREIGYLQLVDAIYNKVVKTIQLPTNNYKQISILFADKSLKVGGSYKLLSYAKSLEDAPTLEFDTFQIKNTSTLLLGEYNKYLR